MTARDLISDWAWYGPARGTILAVFVAAATPSALAAQDARASTLRTTGTQEGPSTLVAWREKIWRVYADGTIDPPFAFPGRDTQHANHGTTFPLPSDDNRYIAFTRDNDLWMLELATGAETRATHLGWPSTPGNPAGYVLTTQWSADSRRFLYYVKPGHPGDPRWAAPNLTVPSADYGFQIYDLESGQSTPVRIPGDFLAWLPSGDIVLRVGGMLRNAQLFHLGAHDSALTMVTPVRGWFDRVDPRIYDNRLLAAIFRPKDRVVWIDLATGAVEDVATFDEMGRNVWPYYSPSDTRVAHQVFFPVDGWVVDDGEVVYRCRDCTPKWIDDHAIAILHGRELVVVDVATAQVIGRRAIR